MSIENLLQAAKSKLQGRFPRYVNLDEAASRSRLEVADMVTEKVAAAMEQAILGAQSKLRSTSQEYVEALYVTEDFQIAIRDEAKRLEEGYDSFEMLPHILAGKSAQKKDDGGTFAIVPIGDKPESDVVSAISKKTSELFTRGRRDGASGRSLSDMVSQMRSLATRSGNVPSAPRNFPTSPEDEFRTATSDQNPAEKWVHPGFEGVNQLEFINSQLKVELEESATAIVERAADGMRR